MNNIKNALSQDNGLTYALSQPKSREKREFEVGQWPLDSLCDEVYLQLESIDYELADYVMKEAIGRIFDTIGEPYLKLCQTSYGLGARLLK